MNAFDLLAQIRRNGGWVELDDDRVIRYCALPHEVEILAMNREAIKDALRNPGRWPCRAFRSHAVDSKLACRTCGEGCSVHPPDLRLPCDPAPLLAQASAIVAVAVAQTSMERAS